jgi:hypothetical protein
MSWRCRIPETTYEMISMSRCGWRPKPCPPDTRSSLMTRCERTVTAPSNDHAFRGAKAFTLSSPVLAPRAAAPCFEGRYSPACNQRVRLAAPRSASAGTDSVERARPPAVREYSSPNKRPKLHIIRTADPISFETAKRVTSALYVTGPPMAMCRSPGVARLELDCAVA